ncbi:MAG: hypothetical protein ACE5H4_07370 [Candidatus Thorarchaeota archaeon]
MTTCIVLTLLILGNHPVYISSTTQKSLSLTESLDVESYLEYQLSTHIMVLWNYTLDEGVIHTYPGEVLYSETESVVVTIRIDVLAEPAPGTFSVLIGFRADTEIGYKTRHSVLADYSPQSGACTIMNGTLENQSGILRLFSDDNWPENDIVVSSLGNLHVGAELAKNDDVRMVMGEAQVTASYDCDHMHIVDGVVSHSRNYDKDSHVLVKAGGGIADMILLGLANLSYCVGGLDLIDTNLDLGPPFEESLTSPLSVLGPVFIGVFVVFYALFYRAQRKRRSTKHTPKKLKRKNQWISLHSSARYSVSKVVIVLKQG